MTGRKYRRKEPGRWTSIYWPDRVLREEAIRRAALEQVPLSAWIRGVVADALGVDRDE